MRDLNARVAIWGVFLVLLLVHLGTPAPLLVLGGFGLIWCVLETTWLTFTLRRARRRAL